ncbi:MAG TPA: MlaD family protein [Stellaceae bacterium]|nr:MlaD family protein [Stellaceae bacterium]
METRAHYVAVGAFVLALVFLGFTAVLWLAGTQFAVNYDHYDIFFKGPVTGLSKGAAVDYNGIRVGQVSEIEIDPNNVEQIRVTVEIKSSVVIKEDAAANVETNILSGVSYILITRGTQEAKTLTAREGQRYPVIRARRSTLASISARGPQLLEKLDDILDHVDDLLNDHNREVFAETLEHVEKFTGALSAHSDDIGQLVAEGKNTLTSLDKLSTDVDNSYTTPDGVKDQLVGMLKGLTLASRQIEVTLQETRPGIRTFSQHTLVDIDSLVGELRQFISGLSRLAAQLERDPTRLLFGDRREGYQPK